MSAGRRAGLLGLLLVGAAGGGVAAEPRFELPIACTVGADCFVQNYVDDDPGPGFADFTCGRLGYDGHKGTDIRLPTLAEMARGVAVRAAAAGTVLRVRDGMADVSTAATGREAITGREAGNSVILDHGDGWETQYAHLRRGSVAVHPGDKVAAGDVIGQVGLSGDTEFPHLHFEVRHDGATVDPFLGSVAVPACGVAGTPLWSDAAAAALAYRPGGLMAAGFTAEAPDLAALREGRYAAPAAAPATASPALVFWAYLFGLQAGDRLTLVLSGPDGAEIARNDVEAPRDKADFMAFAGRKLGGTAWPLGRYRGEVTLTRSVGGTATIVAAETRTLELR